MGKNLEDHVIKIIHKEKLYKVYRNISILAENKLKAMVQFKLAYIERQEDLIEFHNEYKKIYQVSLRPEKYTVEELQAILGYRNISNAIEEIAKEK